MKKIICIFVFMLLISISFSSVAKIIYDEKVDNDTYTNIQQVIENKIISSDNWFEQAKLLASDGGSDEWFGRKVAISGDYAIITAPYDNDNGYWSGSAYIFKRDGSNWTEELKLLASDGTTDDRFGWSISINGDYAIFGAPLDDDNGASSGSAYIFKRDGTNWTEQAKLLASDGESGNHFGNSVSLSGDYALIGAPCDDDNGGFSGSAYIFKRDGATWTQEAKLLASDGAASDSFGWVSISGDYALIGSKLDDDNGEDSGSAYIFKRDGATWTQEAKLLASDGVAYDTFGYSVSIDGNYTIIGSPYDWEGPGEGAAYIFKRDGTTWTEQAKLIASDGAASDRFGNSVQIDGYYAIIGALFDDDNGANSGSAYIFKRDGTSWTEQDKILASDGAGSDWFGLDVSISSNYAVVGAYGDDDSGSKSGSAYVFKRLNQPPYIPSDPDPFDGESGVELDHNLSWTGGDPDPEDTVIYDVYFGTNNPPTLVSSGQEDEEYNPGTLNLEETYYWQIISWDNHENSTSGSIWSFTTINNNPPDAPSIDGPYKGSPGISYEYGFTSYDPETHDVAEYIVKWGDDTGEEIIVGPFGSGVEVFASHSWDKRETYKIQAKAKDVYGAEGDWAEFEITIPRTRTVSYLWYQLLLERFPLLERLLNLLR